MNAVSSDQRRAEWLNEWHHILFLRFFRYGFPLANCRHHLRFVQLGFFKAQYYNTECHYNVSRSNDTKWCICVHCTYCRYIIHYIYTSITEFSSCRDKFVFLHVQWIFCDEFGLDCFDLVLFCECFKKQQWLLSARTRSNLIRKRSIKNL